MANDTSMTRPFRPKKAAPPDPHRITDELHTVSVWCDRCEEQVCRVATLADGTISRIRGRRATGLGQKLLCNKCGWGPRKPSTALLARVLASGVTRIPMSRVTK